MTKGKRPTCPTCKMTLRRMYMKISGNGKVGVAWGCVGCEFIKWDGKRESK